jgi:hypothetical protein
VFPGWKRRHRAGQYRFLPEKCKRHEELAIVVLAISKASNQMTLEARFDSIHYIHILFSMFHTQELQICAADLLETRLLPSAFPP